MAHSGHALQQGINNNLDNNIPLSSSRKQPPQQQLHTQAQQATLQQQFTADYQQQQQHEQPQQQQHQQQRNTISHSGHALQQATNINTDNNVPSLSYGNNQDNNIPLSTPEKKPSPQQPHTQAQHAILQQQFTTNYQQLQQYEQSRQQQQQHTSIMAHNGQALQTTNFNTDNNIPLSSS